MDVLADILASLHLTGGVVLDAETSGDWCLSSQFTPEDCAQIARILRAEALSVAQAPEPETLSPPVIQ